MSSTREDVAAALVALPDDGISSPTWDEITDAAIEAYEANPPAWLVNLMSLVVLVDNQDFEMFAAVPVSVRRAAGLTS